MQIIFLNTYHGRLLREITKFISNRIGETEIFCFQEVYEGVMKDITTSLFSKYQSKYAHKKINRDEEYLQGTFIKTSSKIVNERAIFSSDAKLGLGIVTTIKYKTKMLHILNFHGLAYPGKKQDTNDRLEQSQKIIEYFRNLDDPVIIGGDFNLDKETDSIGMFEKSGYKNLISDFHIKTTRNKVAWERHSNMQRWADFVFVNSKVKVKSFEVPNIIVSDHLPLILNIY